MHIPQLWYFVHLREKALIPIWNISLACPAAVNWNTHGPYTLRTCFLSRLQFGVLGLLILTCTVKTTYQCQLIPLGPKNIHMLPLDRIRFSFMFVVHNDNSTGNGFFLLHLLGHFFCTSNLHLSSMPMPKENMNSFYRVIHSLECCFFSRRYLFLDIV